jgi:hypothetical protein
MIIDVTPSPIIPKYLKLKIFRIIPNILEKVTEYIKTFDF